MARRVDGPPLRPVSAVEADLRDKLTETILRYAREPGEFVRDILRQQPQRWQYKWMNAVACAKRGEVQEGYDKVMYRFSIRSGTGVGKTNGVACLILWGLGCFVDAKVPCTAPTSPQIKAVLWPELRKLVSGIPGELKVFFPFDVTGDMVKLDDNFAVARTAREETPEAFQGFHSKNTILVGDEASGIPQPIFLAGQGAMSDPGAITIFIGNPTRAAGFFYDSHTSDKHLYWTMRVGCQDSEIVSPSYIEEMRGKHGQESYEYKVRVLGEFHTEDSGTIIPRPWIDEAVERDVTPDSDYIIWGFDVSDGRDKSALAKRKGNILLEPVRSWGGKEVMQSVGIVVDEYWSASRDMRPDEICVDAIGMGTGAAQRLREILKGEPVRVTSVVVSLTGSQVGERYTSRRVELWAWGRAWFESGLVRIPAGCGSLARQLSAVEWEVRDSNGKWAIVDKAILGHSPDEADAFLLTFGGLRRSRSGFTKDTKGRKIIQEQTGVGSASYLTGEQSWQA